jgi:hypothetical protein
MRPTSRMTVPSPGSFAIYLNPVTVRVNPLVALLQASWLVAPLGRTIQPQPQQTGISDLSAAVITPKFLDPCTQWGWGHALQVERGVQVLQDGFLETAERVGVLEDDGRDLQVVADPCR